MKRIYVMLPAFNEDSDIEDLIERWEMQIKNIKEYEVIITVINDCSTDNTENIVNYLKDKYSNIKIINHSKNLGLSGGLNTGIKYFYYNASDDDLLVFMDADNTHNPKYINGMIKKIEKGNDCVIASRYRNNSKVVGLAKMREAMSNMARIYYTIILHIPNVRDYTCGYRIYNKKIIDKLVEKYGEEPIKEKSFACMMEFLYKIYAVGAKFDEEGFTLQYDNKKSSSKMKVVKTVNRSIVTALKLKHKEIIIHILLILFAFYFSLGTNFSPINNSYIRS